MWFLAAFRIFWAILSLKFQKKQQQSASSLAVDQPILEKLNFSPVGESNQTRLLSGRWSHLTAFRKLFSASSSITKIHSGWTLFRKELTGSWNSPAVPIWPVRVQNFSKGVDVWWHLFGWCSGCHSTTIKHKPNRDVHCCNTATSLQAYIAHCTHGYITEVSCSFAYTWRSLMADLFHRFFGSFPKTRRALVSTFPKALHLVCLLFAITKAGLAWKWGETTLRGRCSPCKFQRLNEEGETDLELIETIKGQSETLQSC